MFSKQCKNLEKVGYIHVYVCAGLGPENTPDYCFLLVFFLNFPVYSPNYYFLLVIFDFFK